MKSEARPDGGPGSAPPTAPLSMEVVAALLESTCALIEAERRGFAGRIRDLLAGKPIQSWDQAQVARDRKDCERMSQSLWMEFMGLRHDSIALVRSLKPADMDKSGTHPKVGLLRVRDLLQEWPYHDRNHTRQLLYIQQERVYPDMGNSQQFVGE